MRSLSARNNNSKTNRWHDWETPWFGDGEPSGVPADPEDTVLLQSWWLWFLPSDIKEIWSYVSSPGSLRMWFDVKASFIWVVAWDTRQLETPNFIDIMAWYALGSFFFCLQLKSIDITLLCHMGLQAERKKRQRKSCGASSHVVPRSLICDS